MSKPSAQDRDISELIRAEFKRQSTTLDLIASENHASASVLEAMGSVLTDKYAEGYPRKRCYYGCEVVDLIEQTAVDRAMGVFGAEHANVQPHSGTSANLAVYMAALKNASKILAMDLSHGGHLSHGHSINFSGTFFEVVKYGVNRDTETLDPQVVADIALKERPDLIVVGASSYPRKIDFDVYADIAKRADCMLMADVAHIAGLIAGGVHPSPVGRAQFVTTSTHKTLRGPRGGLVLCDRSWAGAIDRAVFPGIQGGPLMHVIAAKAVALSEALREDFKDYAAAIVANARALAEALMARGWRLVSGGTDNHLLLIDLRSRVEDFDGVTVAGWLAAGGIVTNHNVIPFDPRPPLKASGIRLGTPALTTRGLNVGHMKIIAGWIDKIISSRGDEDVISRVRGEVEELCGQFPLPAGAS